RPDAARGEEDVDAAAAAEVEDGLAFAQLSQECRIAAAERGQQRFDRQAFALGTVKAAGDRIGTARLLPARRFGVLGADRFLDRIHLSEYEYIEPRTRFARPFMNERRLLVMAQLNERTDTARSVPTQREKPESGGGLLSRRPMSGGLGWSLRDPFSLM